MIHNEVQITAGRMKRTIRRSRDMMTKVRNRVTLTEMVGGGRSRLSLGITAGVWLVMAAVSTVFGQSATNQPAVVRVACLGDSLTYQEYPAPLGKLLGAGYQVEDFGVPCATVLKQGDVSYWKRGKIEAAEKFGPQIVTILLGTNDTRPQNWGHKDSFLGDYKALIERVRQFPTKPKIYILIPTPVFGTPTVAGYAFDGAIVREGVTPLIEQAAKESGVEVIDLYSLLAKSPEMSVDGVHLNAAADAIIAKRIYEVLTAAH
jgi:lysophospholipase L1-like esterase